ncbi:L,D-transpeptidase family protein [Sulfidibacter corallicola]|uniref:L,D-transpeptidase family protein n=1 Tax=Sulfidibacter corallicola TaxID=2818388 RepID=A0A8A4TLD8_SULCO|nr:L,D-transpeptidase family protein [Sulfidibacter corallicola]QTD49932.1 L,D-transpeptidase family protein [Sulfidibacter corallicola]
MADLVYYINKESLEWPSKNKTWKAVTGPWKKGSLPKGSYTVKRNHITQYTSAIGASFQDETGQGFFLPIEPDFNTIRSGLGIHPDGGVAGTEGCIGLKERAAEFYREIAGTAFGTLSLEVQD